MECDGEEGDGERVCCMAHKCPVGPTLNKILRKEFHVQERCETRTEIDSRSSLCPQSFHRRIVVEHVPVVGRWMEKTNIARYLPCRSAELVRQSTFSCPVVKMAYPPPPRTIAPVS